MGGDGVVRIFEKLVGSPPLPSDEDAHEIYIHLLEDLRRMEDFEKRYPLAMVAFGSARLASDDPYYALAVEVGERMAQRGYLVRTGAGPGIMDAVPVGWKKAASRRSSLVGIEDQTQGIRIELPFEQAVSPSIDTNTMMKTFAIRRTALIWNSRGIAVFPGGMGTINEVFEAWLGAADHKVACPIVVIPNDFYKPFLDAIQKVAVGDRGTISASDFGLVERSLDADEAVQLLQQPMRQKAPGTQFTLREKLLYLRHELGRGLTVVSNLRPAVVIVGPRHSPSREDSEVQFIGKLSNLIVQSTSLGIRLGVNGVINEAVTESMIEAVSDLDITNANVIQRILMREEEVAEDADAHFESRSAHCETLIENAKAALFLPGDLPTLNILFALVCEIQTRRRARMPVYLVGSAFWKPILEVSGSFFQLLTNLRPET